MVVDDGDLVCVPIDPTKDDPPLVVDADRMELLQITLEFLQAVGRRDPQVLEPGCSVDGLEPTLRPPRNALEPPDDLIGKQPFRPPVAEGPDHAFLYRNPVYGRGAGGMPRSGQPGGT